MPIMEHIPEEYQFLGNASTVDLELDTVSNCNGVGAPEQDNG